MGVDTLTRKSRSFSSSPCISLFAISSLLTVILAPALPNARLVVDKHLDGKGKEILKVIVPGHFPPKKSPHAAVHPDLSVRGVKMIDGVPAFDWVYGARQPPLACSSATTYSKKYVDDLSSWRVSGKGALNQFAARFIAGETQDIL